MSWREENTPLIGGGGGLADDITGMVVQFSHQGIVYGAVDGGLPKASTELVVRCCSH